MHMKWIEADNITERGIRRMQRQLQRGDSVALQIGRVNIIAFRILFVIIMLRCIGMMLLSVSFQN